MDQLEKIDRTLDALNKEFNQQIQASQDKKDVNMFHNDIIKLTSKYPEHAELLEFIVLVNDRLETKHSIFSDIIIDSFNVLVQNKKSLIDHMKYQNSFMGRIKNFTFKDIKIIGIIGAIITVSIVGITNPELITTIIELIIGAK